MIKLIYILIVLLFAVPGWAGTAYYCDLSVQGGTGGDGSWGNPFESPTDVNAFSFSTGDDVYFLKTASYTLNAHSDRLTVDWTGTLNDRVVIGCYDGQNDFDCGSEPYVDANRPTISGNATYPSSENGIIDIQDEAVDYVTVQDLKIIYSTWYGVVIKYSNYVDVTNCYFYRNNAMSIVHAQSHGDVDTPQVVSYNYIEDGGYPSNTAVGGDIVFTGHHQGGSDYGRVEYNVLTNPGRGVEGIGIYEEASYYTVQYNSVSGYKNVGIYISGAGYSVVRYNLVYGLNLAERTWQCIFVDVEPQHFQSGIDAHGNNKYYGNLLAGCERGMTFSCTISTCTGAGTPTAGCLTDQSDENCAPNEQVYNNTFIDNEINQHWDYMDSADSVLVKNNISYLITNGMVFTSSDSPLGVTWDYNLFYGGNDPVPGGNASSHYRTGDPNIATKSGYRGLSAGSLDGSEFEVQAGGDGIDNGIFISDDYDNLISASDYTASPITVSTTDDGADIDIGAWYYDAGAPAGTSNLQSIVLDSIVIN